MNFYFRRRIPNPAREKTLPKGAKKKPVIGVISIERLSSSDRG